MNRITAYPGEHVSNTAQRMVNLWCETKKPVVCTFNEIELQCARSDVSPADIVDYYDAEAKRRSDEYNAQPETIAARADAERKDREKQTLLQGALAVAGPIELIDAAIWQSWIDANKDPYGVRIMRYADEWARLMQVRIANGETIAECADELSHLSDDDGITGFMYGAAVSILSKAWKHGKELRRWHNHKTQIGTEGDDANDHGGVLNPAMMCIG